MKTKIDNIQRLREILFDVQLVADSNTRVGDGYDDIIKMTEKALALLEAITVAEVRGRDRMVRP